MNILVIGKGGREHAIVKALSKSPKAPQVYVWPGNPAMIEATETWPHLESHELIHVAGTKKVELVIIGPEAELLNGLSDQFRKSGFLVFGPSQKAAQLEGSKIFSKEFMHQFGVPTAGFRIVSSTEETLSSAVDFEAPYVLKADGLCAGKGVFICQTKDELKLAAVKLFDEKIFGESGARALLEEYMPGQEISYFVFTNGQTHQTSPVFRDHKRLLDGNEGPNTGGMGAIGPVSLDLDLQRSIEERIVSPTIQGLFERGLDYRGVLFIGIMLTKGGPKVLEYNVRLGDPEAQCILPSLDGDWFDVFLEVAKGRVPKLNWKNKYVACLVLASPGYPDNPQSGLDIQGSLFQQEPEQYFLGAGLQGSAENPKTGGGRVLNSVGIGTTLAEALTKAYDQAKHVSWPGMHYRKDIGR